MTTIYENTRVKALEGNVLMLSGCRDDQTSADAYISGQSQGALTASIISALNKTSRPRYSKFLNLVRRYLKERRYTQVPQLSSGRSINLSKHLEL